MATTRLGQIGVGVEPYGTFSPKDPAPSSGPHDPGVITRLAQFGVGVAKYGTFQPKTAATPEPEPEVQADVIRNFRLRRERRSDDDAYSWLREARKEDVEQERQAVAIVAVELEQRITQSADETAELSARLQLEMAKEHYLATFEEAYREDMREALIEQWLEEVAYQRYLAQVRRRAALLLLMAH